MSVEAGTLTVVSSLTVWEAPPPPPELSRVAKFIGSAMPAKTHPQLTILKLGTREWPEL